MLSARSRALLEHYSLASQALSRYSGERLAREVGQSVEFHDFRPYQRGDEIRYVDWKVYARSKRLYTRLYQAERSIHAHILLDTSASMHVGHKARFARICAYMLSYAVQQDASCQIHHFHGSSSPSMRGRARIPESWEFIDSGAETSQAAAEPSPSGQAIGASEAIMQFARHTSRQGGAALVLVLSDLLEPHALRPALVALKARGFDASFLHIMAKSDLFPEEGQLELHDAESHEKLLVGPEEVRLYRARVQHFVERCRASILQANFRYSLLQVADHETSPEDISDDAEARFQLERDALAALIAAGIFIKR